MTLVSYQPRRLLKEMNQLLKGEWPNVYDSTKESFLSQWSPDMDIKETESKFMVSVDLPGLKKEDISVSVENHILSIEGERHSEHDEKSEHHHHIERNFGKFRRCMTLPRSADGSHVSAKMQNGVLFIDIAKKDIAKNKSIEIQ